MTAAALAIAAVRMWTYLYTWGLRPDVATRRRAEIESDLWELQHDTDVRSNVSHAAHVVARLIGGLPHDLCWRFEQSAIADMLPRVGMVAATVLFLLAGVWVVPLWSGNTQRPRCPAYQQIAARLHPSASCECIPRAPASGQPSRRRDGTRVTRLICRP